MIMKYRKKPVVIEAVQWTGDNNEEINNFCGDSAKFVTSRLGNAVLYSLGIETLEGFMQASTGDYIIKGVNGEYYPCKPDIFEKTYEKV